MRELTFIICSVLSREVQTFLSLDYPHAEQIYLNSVLHIYLQKLYKTIEAALKTRENRYCVLTYGDCNAHIKAISQRPNCERTRAVNCGELLLGPDLYRYYRNEKVFLFLPEWTERWQEIFQRELGFSDPSLAQEFMQENQRRLVYLDTGLISVPWNHLKEISEFFKCPQKLSLYHSNTFGRLLHLLWNAWRLKIIHDSRSSSPESQDRPACKHY